MNKKTLIFGFVFLILFSSFTLAVPPSDTIINNFYTQEGGNINIEYPNILYYSEGEEIFNFHVFDGETGLILNETEVSCSAKVYTAGGDEVYYEEELTTTDGSIDTFHARTNLSEGKYEGLAYCYNSTDGGYVSAQLFVNNNGYDPNIDSNSIWVLIFTIIIFIVVIFKSKSIVNNESIVAPFRLFFGGITTLLLWGLMGIMVEDSIYTGYYALTNTIYTIFTYVSFAFILVAFILSLWSVIPWIVKIIGELMRKW